MSYTEKEMAFSGTLTVEDLKKFNLYHMKRRYILMATLMFFAMMIIFADWTSSMITLVMMSIGLAAALPLLVSYLQNRNLYKLFREDPGLAERQHYATEKEGLKQETNRSVTFYRWNEIKKIIEHNEMFLLYITREKAIVIPKRYFTLEEEQSKFWEMVNERVTAPVQISKSPEAGNQVDEADEIEDRIQGRDTTAEKFIAAGGHLIALFFPIPLLGILVVALYWMFFRGYSRFTDHHLTENINFQISYALYMIGFAAIGLGMSLLPEESLDTFGLFGILAGFGFVAFVVVFLFMWWIVFIIAIIAALVYKYFKFPLTIRFVKK
ncbi:DUF4870 domain-containing protein [Salibacterium salarium]|nr:YcxB family protein [Salibacterium salarium]